jgi:hypothetical protein
LQTLYSRTRIFLEEIRKPKRFGAWPLSNHIEKYSCSKQWNGSSFENTGPTKLEMNFSPYSGRFTSEYLKVIAGSPYQLDY